MHTLVCILARVAVSCSAKEHLSPCPTNTSGRRKGRKRPTSSSAHSQGSDPSTQPTIHALYPSVRPRRHAGIRPLPPGRRPVALGPLPMPGGPEKAAPRRGFCAGFCAGAVRASQRGRRRGRPRWRGASAFLARPGGLARPCGAVPAAAPLLLRGAAAAGAPVLRRGPAAVCQRRKFQQPQP